MTIESIFDKFLNSDNYAFFYTPPFYKDSYSYIFIKPDVIITAASKEELPGAFESIEVQRRIGKTGYGFINYEMGYYLEDKFIEYRHNNRHELLKFCFFDEKNVIKIKSEEIDFEYKGFNNEYKITGLTYSKSKDEFVSDIERIKHFIEEGDTYQVNYTMKCRFNFEGSYLALFKALIFNQSAEYSAFINNGGNVIISLSPELFFSIEGNEITCKPMKGTIKRGKNVEEDLLNNSKLMNEEKFHAENLMILDLLRNDLGRISKYNSVIVNKLYSVEKYESLFQLISEVNASLKENITFKEIIEGLFPCGSITGAPKIRTMEIIRELEKEARGLYTGAIGLLLKDKTVFNVAIRTISIDKSTGKCEAGIGSGITWDSIPDSEYNETILKSRFLTSPDDYFELFETMLVEHGKISLLDRHLIRLKSAADYFLFIYNEEKIIIELNNSLNLIDTDKKYRLKLTLNKWGKCSIKIAGYPVKLKPVKVVISDSKIPAEDRFRYFKTTNRKPYSDEYSLYSKEGFFDVIYFNQDNFLTEGSITNIFIKKNNAWHTPYIKCGLLPGIYRQYFINKNQGNVFEKEISIEKLLNADELLLTNSLRGEIKVEQLYFNGSCIRTF